MPQALARDHSPLVLVLPAQASTLHEPVSKGGRITVLSLGFFALVIIASYTANLTNSLVAGGRIARTKSLEDAILQRLRICGHRTATENIRTRFPAGVYIRDPSDGEVGMTTRIGVLEQLDSGPVSPIDHI